MESAIILKFSMQSVVFLLTIHALCGILKPSKERRYENEEIQLIQHYEKSMGTG